MASAFVVGFDLSVALPSRGLLRVFGGHSNSIAVVLDYEAVIFDVVRHADDIFNPRQYEKYFVRGHSRTTIYATYVTFH